MIGSPENNNTELRSDTTSGDVSEVESGLEVTESEMDDDLAKELDDKYNKEVDEDVRKQELPSCFSGLSEESKAKQYEALDKMSDEEKKAYFDIIEKEPKITADVQDVANKNGAELQGLEYRVKTPSSTYEKMHEREEGMDIGEMKDVIRYTEIYPPDKLAEGTNASLKDFESRGYTVDRVKNTWDDENTSYRGINANLKGGSKDRYESPTNNQLFEYIKDTEVYRDIIKESMLIMQEKMKAEFDVLRKNARDIAKIIACSDECKIIEAIDSIRNLDENDVICSGLKKVSRAYVNLYYAYMTLSNNYYIHKTDMYACVINNFLSLFEILDVVKNKTLNNILYEETKGVIENIRSKYIDIKNGKINGILSTHNGALRICFGMEYVVANEMQKQLFQFIQSIDELLGETNTDINNIKSKINDLCNNIDDYFDKYQELSEQYVDIRAKLEQRILDDMEKEENVKNIDFYEELKREQLLSCEKKYFLYVELIINSMNLFDMKILSNKEISKYFFIKTERLRNQIKKYVGYTTCKESSILEDSNRYCELKELSLAPCSAEIYYGFLYIEEQVRNVNKCEQLYDLSVKCKELFAKYYFTKQMIFGKKTRYYLKTLVTLYAQILWCIKKVNNADIEKKCIKKLGISFKQVRNLVTCMNNAGQIKEDVNDIVVYFEQYLSK